MGFRGVSGRAGSYTAALGLGLEVRVFPALGLASQSPGLASGCSLRWVLRGQGLGLALAAGARSWPCALGLALSGARAGFWPGQG